MHRRIDHPGRTSESLWQTYGIQIFSAQIDWRFEINAVVAEVDETYEFVMGKAGKQAVF